MVLYSRVRLQPGIVRLKAHVISHIYFKLHVMIHQEPLCLWPDHFFDTLTIAYRYLKNIRTQYKRSNVGSEQWPIQSNTVCHTVAHGQIWGGGVRMVLALDSRLKKAAASKAVLGDCCPLLGLPPPSPKFSRVPPGRAGEGRGREV